MSRFMQAIEEAENGYVEEIDTLKQIRDNLMGPVQRGAGW